MDDDFDDALASIDIPSAPKVAKIAENSNNGPNPVQSVDKSKLNAPTSSHCIQFRDVVPDYVVGKSSCILYLSLRYHILNPEYICQRLQDLGKSFTLRVLLVQVDVPEPHNALKSLTRISLLADLTLMLAWNAEEAAKIIENYKLFEHQPPDLIMARGESDAHQKLVNTLTSIKTVNKTDAVSLLQNFGNLENIAKASMERLSLVTGMGPRKAKILHDRLREPFMRK